MALTPNEERKIHQIEAALIETDPGFVARMTGLFRPRRWLVVAAVCLFAVAVVLAGLANFSVFLCCAAVAMFAAGWCLGRAGHLDLWSWPCRIGNATVRFVRDASWPVRRRRR